MGKEKKDSYVFNLLILVMFLWMTVLSVCMHFSIIKSLSTSPYFCSSHLGYKI